MGGQIDVESSPGTGSEFRFSVSFDLGRGESRPVLEERLRSLNILVVDDHPLTRVILTQACVGFGWQATAVDSGAAGLNELRCCAENGRHYDLVLLDWRMPGMDGLDMLRQGHATPGISLPPVVLMTPMFEMEQAVAASDDLHLDGIAAKPMTPANLLDAVKRAYSGEYLSILPAQGKPDRRLAGMRLLVAEDNALNQEVAEEILTRAGAEVVIASNGLAVVEALRKPSARFDAVLMDIQMPLMDGYTATRLIRDELGQTDLSIIAVTAFARPEDREKSRLAGMVGHLVKPLDVEDLLDIVDKTRRSTGVQLAVANQDSLARAMKLGGLDVAAALKVFGSDQKKYVKFLRKFIVQQGGCPNEARRLFDADDLPGAAKILHDLSGMAGMLHATELARLAAVAESGLLKAELDGMLPLLVELQVAMQTLKESVDQIEVLWA
jgi:CheY-like chemotaxis protein